MPSLPKRYIAVARDLTGYWGAYPLSRPVKPGEIGRSTNGVFEHERHLRNLPEVDFDSYAQFDQPTGDSYNAWRSDGVHDELLELGLPAVATTLPVGAQIKLSFKGAQSACISLRAARYIGFEDLVPIREVVLRLWEEKVWDADWVLVTEVMAAQSAAIVFATEAGQSASFRVSASLPFPGDVLSLVAEPSVSRTASSSMFERAPDQCTPLFKAVRMRRTFRGWRPESVRAVKGPDDFFEEPIFGDLE
jgi:hypothetical protein